MRGMGINQDGWYVNTGENRHEDTYLIMFTRDLAKKIDTKILDIAKCEAPIGHLNHLFVPFTCTSVRHVFLKIISSYFFVTFLTWAGNYSSLMYI